jgi:hypothetical protein
MASMQDSYILAAFDRTVFLCSVEATQSELHWVFVTAAHARYAGPRWTRVLSEPELRALLNDWWQWAKELAHPRVDQADAIDGSELTR